MARTLKLTSPHIKGDDVRAAQALLKENRFKQDYLQGPVDGVFGEGTARACKRAKYWLGYALKDMDPIYGTLIGQYLKGTKKLPTTYAKRRASRLKPPSPKPLRVKALAKAITQIGVEESPANSNKQKYGVWYGFNGVSWCAIFATWCYVLSGSKVSFKKGSHWAYVPWIVHAARQGDFGMAVTSNPLPGDLVCYDWEGNGVADHVGLFEAWTDKSAGKFTAIEGNTAVGNDSNGGKVMRRDRTRSNVQAFVHVAG